MGNNLEAIIRKNYVITIPPKIRNLLKVKEGDSVIFKIIENNIIIGGIKRTIIKEEIKFDINAKE